MRFCMITTFYPPYNFGGDGILIHRLANALAHRGHSVDVIHCIDAYRLLARREPDHEAENHPNVTVHGLRSRWGPLSPLATYLAGRPVFKAGRIREILTRSFDVIHYHNISLVGGPGILAYGEALKLYTMHDYWLVCPTHVLFRNRRTACTERRCLRCLLAYRRPPQFWRWGRLLRSSLRHVDVFLSAARFVQEQHEGLGIEGRCVRLPHFGPDPAGSTGAPGEAQDAEAPESEASPPSSPGFFLFVGRLEKLKGLQTILPIFRRRSDLALRIVGTGTYERSLQRMAAGAPNVRFLGWQEGERLRRLYRDAIALLLPSLCYEIYPLVALEAGGEGTPVLARKIGALPEMLASGTGGALFETAEECEQAMDRLRRSAKDRAKPRRSHGGNDPPGLTIDAYLERYLGIISRIQADTRPRGFVGSADDRSTH